jgi:ubiquitin-activating enzyme E1
VSGIASIVEFAATLNLHEAKNIVLAGVRSVTIFDPEPVQIQDLGTQVRPGLQSIVHYARLHLPYQFFLRPEDVGKSRAEATLPRLAELNAYVPVKNLGGKPGEPITVDLLKGFEASRSVICGYNLVSQLLFKLGCCSHWCTIEQATRDQRLDTCKRSAFCFCRYRWAFRVSIHFYSPIELIQCRVNCSAAFNDFGPKFTCVDPTGEQPLTGMVVQIEKVTIAG